MYVFLLSLEKGIWLLIHWAKDQARKEAFDYFPLERSLLNCTHCFLCVQDLVRMQLAIAVLYLRVRHTV